MTGKISDLYKFPEGLFVRQSHLMEILPFSAATLWRMVKDGSFPKPRKISKRVTVWLVVDVQRYLDSVTSDAA